LPKSIDKPFIINLVDDDSEDEMSDVEFSEADGEEQ